MQVITHRKHGANLTETEKWLSIIAGSALAVYGLTRRTRGGVATAVFGGSLIHRGATGHCYVYEALGVSTAAKGQGSETTSVPYELGIRVDHAVTINRPRADVYAFWRDLENLPRFMEHLQSVKVLDETRSHWVAQAPAGRTVEWDAVIHNEIPNERLAWRSLPGASVDHAGAVIFSDAPAGRGTEVRVELQYNPPGGMVGAALAKLWREEPSQQIRSDMQRLKQILEAGEVITTKGQPSGRETKATEKAHRSREKEVSKASEESFPASDAPAYSR
jgi:uncharacterized membrane protein